MTTRKSLRDSLKRQKQRLPHGYELVARKKRSTKRKKATRKAAPKRKVVKRHHKK